MQSTDEEFIEDQRRKAISIWKWRNLYLAALLAFIHPGLPGTGKQNPKKLNPIS